MRFFRLIFLASKHPFRAYFLWFALGLLYLLAYVWPLFAAETPSDSTQVVPTTQDVTQPAISLQDSLNIPTIKTDPIDVTPLPDPNQPPPDWITPSGDSTQVLDDFEYPKRLNSYPDDIWGGRSGLFYRETPKAEVYYKIQKEGENHYLAAQTTGEAVNFGRETNIKSRGRERKANLRQYKKLRWRWRVHSLPEGSDERESNTNDSAAAVRLVFRTGILPTSGKSLKYIWSETLPSGTVIKSGNQYTIVLRSGQKDLGKWVWEEINAYDDYVHLFGGNPRPVDLLGLLTDSNNTDSFVKADYDDITFIIPRPDNVKMIPDFMLDNP